MGRNPQMAHMHIDSINSNRVFFLPQPLLLWWSPRPPKQGSLSPSFCVLFRYLSMSHPCNNCYKRKSPVQKQQLQFAMHEHSNVVIELNWLTSEPLSWYESLKASNFPSGDRMSVLFLSQLHGHPCENLYIPPLLPLLRSLLLSLSPSTHSHSRIVSLLPPDSLFPLHTFTVFSPLCCIDSDDVSCPSSSLFALLFLFLKYFWCKTLLPHNFYSPFLLLLYSCFLQWKRKRVLRLHLKRHEKRRLIKVLFFPSKSSHLLLLLRCASSSFHLMTLEYTERPTGKQEK